MIKKTAFSILFLTLPAILLSIENEQSHNIYRVLCHEKNHLIDIAQNYLKFVHDVGSAQSIEQDNAIIKTLFAQNLTKIDNRSILFENNRELLLPQMKGFEKEFNPTSNKADWVVEIDNALIVPSIETNSVVIHFEWLHVNIGRATTMAILQCNSNNQIERIIEVWAKVHK